MIPWKDFGGDSVGGARGFPATFIKKKEKKKSVQKRRNLQTPKKRGV